jgi:hypothetical protein
MSSAIYQKSVFYTKTRTLDINGLSSDSSPDLEADKMLVFANANQPAAHSIRLVSLNYKGNSAEVLCDNKLSISQSTNGSFSPIPESYVYIPPLKTYFIFYTFIYTTAANTTGFQPVIDIDSNLVLRCARFVTNSSGTAGQAVTPNGDSTVAVAAFTGVSNSAIGSMCIGEAIISNTNASNIGESFMKFTTEVSTSAAQVVAQQVSKICGRMYLRIMELE